MTVMEEKCITLIFIFLSDGEPLDLLATPRFIIAINALLMILDLVSAEQRSITKRVNAGPKHGLNFSPHCTNFASRLRPTTDELNAQLTYLKNS